MTSLNRNITKIGVLACLTYVMWYKWVYGDQGLVLYATAAVAIGGTLMGLLSENIHLNKVFPYVCFKDIVMCAYSLIVGIFVATSQSVLVSTIFTYLAFSLVCLAACYACWNYDFNWLLKGFIAIALLCAVWTLTQGYHLVGYGMVLSETNNPHTLGFVMNLGIFAVAYLSKNTTKSFAFNMMLVALFLYIIIQCGSRKCLLAAVFIIIPWLWIEIVSMYKHGTTVQKLFFTILVVVLFLGIAYYLGGAFLNSDSYIRMKDIEESKANKARLYYYSLGFDFLLDSPMFGIGLGQFAVLNPKATYAHAVIPEAIASWGMVGSLMYFLPIVTISYRAFSLAKHKHDKSTIIVAGLCAMELFMGFLQIYFYDLTHIIAWMIIAWYVNNNGK